MFRAARWKLTLWYGAAVTAVLVAVAVSTFLIARQSLDDGITSAITGAHSQLATLDPQRFAVSVPLDGRGGRGGAGNRTGHESAEDVTAALASDVFYLTVLPGGSVLVNPRNIDVSGIQLADSAREASENGHFEDVTANTKRYRLASYTTPATSAGQPVVLVVGNSLDNRDRDLDAILRTLAVATLGGLALSIAGGFWLAGRALTPIRQAMETQRRFISDASHELRTPITVIKANNELLLRHPDQSIEENIDQVGAIDQESDHMARLVDDLLTLARADEGRLELRSERVDVGELAADLSRAMAPVAEAKGIRLAADTEPCAVDGDAGRLRQLLLIVLDNAVKYTPAGGAVTVTAHPAGRRVEVAVQDTGRGITTEDQAHLFDRFYRVDAGRTRGDSGGSGLGLAIARELAEAHGGRIAVESVAGNGSRFVIRLPKGH